MTEKINDINVLYVPPKELRNNLSKIKSFTKEQSKAIHDIGANFVIFQGETDGELIEALKDVDVGINQGHSITTDIYSEIGNN